MVQRYDQNGNKDDNGKFVATPLALTPEQSAKDLLGEYLYNLTPEQFADMIGAFAEEALVRPSEVETIQRLVNPDKVAEYSDFEPRLGQEALVFDIGGRKILLDGNHRMAAAAESDTPLSTLIVRLKDVHMGSVDKMCKRKTIDYKFVWQRLHDLEDQGAHANVAKTFKQILSKINENHDDTGRFAPGNGGTSGGSERLSKPLSADHASALKGFVNGGPYTDDTSDALAHIMNNLKGDVPKDISEAADIVAENWDIGPDSWNDKEVLRYGAKLYHYATGLEKNMKATLFSRALAKAQNKTFGKSEPFTKTSDDQQIIYGWASVIKQDGKAVVDLQGDVISEPELVKAAHDYITEARVAKMMHNGKQIGEVVESVVFTDDLQKALGIDLGKSGWFIGMKIHDANIWKNQVKTGKMLAFSVGGSGQRVAIKSED